MWIRKQTKEKTTKHNVNLTQEICYPPAKQLWDEQQQFPRNYKSTESKGHLLSI